MIDTFTLSSQPRRPVFGPSRLVTRVSTLPAPFGPSRCDMGQVGSSSAQVGHHGTDPIAGAGTAVAPAADAPAVVAAPSFEAPALAETTAPDVAECTVSPLLAVEEPTGSPQPETTDASPDTNRTASTKSQEDTNQDSWRYIVAPAWSTRLSSTRGLEGEINGRVFKRGQRIRFVGVGPDYDGKEAIVNFVGKGKKADQLYVCGCDGCADSHMCALIRISATCAEVVVQDLDGQPNEDSEVTEPVASLFKKGQTITLTGMGEEYQGKQTLIMSLGTGRRANELYVATAESNVTRIWTEPSISDERPAN